jgi:hypothetical protein
LRAGVSRCCGEEEDTVRDDEVEGPAVEGSVREGSVLEGSVVDRGTVGGVALEPGRPEPGLRGLGLRELVRRERDGGEPRDAGMATAEYAMATLAACGFAGLLIAVLRSDEVRGMLLGIVRQALTLG